MPTESFAVFWPWLVLQCTSLIGGLWDLWKHLRMGQFSSVFSYAGVKISSRGWSFAFHSAFWNLYLLQLLSFPSVQVTLVWSKWSPRVLFAPCDLEKYVLFLEINATLSSLVPRFECMLDLCKGCKCHRIRFLTTSFAFAGGVLGIEPRNSCILSTLPTTKLYFQPQLAPL